VKKWGSGDLPQEKLVRAILSRMSENAFLNNGIEIAAITYLCAEKETLI